MSHNALGDEDLASSLRPRPRRPFDLSSTSNSPTATPPMENQNFHPSQLTSASLDGASTPSRTKSILNLTSSTLFGIYSPTGFSADREEPSTPWGTGAETPAEPASPITQVSERLLFNGPNAVQKRRRSTITPRSTLRRPARGLQGYWLPLVARTLALFGVGVLYGLLISHLHDKRELAPVKVDGLDRSSWYYLAFWGTAGVLLGQALPYLDALWNAENEEAIDDTDEDEEVRRRDKHATVEWNSVVRSIGAFVGIAFAIRKLPWQSTLQLSLTLALANPALWYLIDRSPPGFILSSIVALTGTGILLGINPALVPSPSPQEVLNGHVRRHGVVSNGTSSLYGNGDLVLGVFSLESIGVATWIASVLFVSSVCFGNIGRKLAPQRT
nr:hypothetical protein B0A51_12270 [Rachicladosporium sp. CCFEE 5018]